MYVLYYALIFWCWHLVWILVRTDHPCLGVGCHMGIIPSRSISPRRLRYVSKSFKETLKKVFYSDYIQRTLRSAIWRELDYHLIICSFVVLALGPKSRSAICKELDYHLIICSFVVLALGPKHNTLFLLIAA
jgi:hypothetical protein